jgi:hypothetical protein
MKRKEKKRKEKKRKEKEKREENQNRKTKLKNHKNLACCESQQILRRDHFICAMRTREQSSQHNAVSHRRSKMKRSVLFRISHCNQLWTYRQHTIQHYFLHIHQNTTLLFFSFLLPLTTMSSKLDAAESRAAMQCIQERPR